MGSRLVEHPMEQIQHRHITVMVIGQRQRGKVCVQLLHGANDLGVRLVTRASCRGAYARRPGPRRSGHAIMAHELSDPLFGASAAFVGVDLVGCDVFFVAAALFWA